MDRKVRVRGCFAAVVILSPLVSFLSCSQNSRRGFPSYLSNLPGARAWTLVLAAILETELGWLLSLLPGRNIWIEAGAGVCISRKVLPGTWKVEEMEQK